MGRKKRKRESIQEIEMGMKVETEKEGERKMISLLERGKQII